MIFLSPLALSPIRLTMTGLNMSIENAVDFLDRDPIGELLFSRADPMLSLSHSVHRLAGERAPETSRRYDRRH